MTEAERADIINTLAVHPEMGVSLGGGFRVLHFYREEGMPLFLLTAFAKNERANITPKEQADLVTLCDLIAKAYRSAL